MIVAAEVTTVAIVLCILAILAHNRPAPAVAGGARDPKGGGTEPIAVIDEPNGHAPPPTQPGPVPGTTPAATQTALTAQEARRALDSGKALLASGKLLEARTQLSRAVFSGRLAPAEEAQAVAAAAEAANKTILSRELIEGDPYNVPYMVQAGQTLAGAKGIEMTERLHVPERLLLKVNGLARGADMRPGRTIKLIRGPFHAVVYKGRFLMDLHLQRDDQEKVFIRRVPVGLGRNGSTPVGAWRVKWGEKKERPTYTATEGSGLPVGKIVLFGEPGYPFGTKALWISLEGTDPQTKTITDFGIHSTNDPASIGKANSLGCVRMADNDIDLVFSLLYDVHSRVDVVP